MAESKGQPFTQCIAFSNDRGRTFTKWNGNPALKNVAGDNRDPKVFWHEETKRWVMVVVLALEHKVVIYSSTDLKNWTEESKLGPAGATGARRGDSHGEPSGWG